VRSVRAAKRGECEMGERDGEEVVACRFRCEEDEEEIRGVRAGSVRWRERVGCAVGRDAIVGRFFEDGEALGD